MNDHPSGHSVTAPAAPGKKPSVRPEHLPCKLRLGSTCAECDGTCKVPCSWCGGRGTRKCGAPDCDGLHECDECHGVRREHCPVCVHKDEQARERIAEEATRLWRRDIGRGITTGAARTYIEFAIQAYRDGEIGGAS